MPLYKKKRQNCVLPILKKREDDINKFANDEQTAINTLIAEHDKKAKEFQESYAKRENEETSKMVASIQTATNNVAKQKNYTLVLASIVQ